MEEQWIVDRSKLREVWLDHPEWSKRQLVEATGRSKAWVMIEKTIQLLLYMVRLLILDAFPRRLDASF